MKNYLILFALALIAFLAFNAKTMPEAQDVEYTGAEALNFEPNASNVVRYTFTADTITDAENDTLAFPFNVFSSYSSLYQLVRTNLSGTTNVSVTLQQSALTSGNTDWVTVATTSGTGATAEALTLNPTYGVRYRLIVDGSGTQSTRYVITAVLKKTN